MAKINTEKLVVTQVDQITAYDNTGKIDFIMDEVQDTTLSQEEEIVDITGRGGRKIGSLKKNKAVTGSGTNGVITGGAIAAMLGSEVKNGTNKVRFLDPLVVASGKVTLTNTPVGVAGNEVPFIYLKEADDSLGMELTQDATASAGKYEVNAQEVTFFSDVQDGTKVVAVYQAEVESAVITNTSDRYSKTVHLIIDCLAQDSCDNQYHVQFDIPRADFHGTFDIAIGSDPSTLAFEFGALAGGCTGSNAFWDMIVY